MNATRVRVPKMAEVVSDDLRRRIARGEFGEGDQLPPVVDLITAYGISRPTIREAYRVLESEQLIAREPTNRSVYKVRMPSADVAGQYAALLLRLRGATVGDVRRALTELPDDGPAIGMVRAILAASIPEGSLDDDPPRTQPRTDDGRPAAALARQLRDAISRGELADGEWLPPETALGERFGVSRSALREGVRILESEGLVTVRRGATGGAVVTRPRPERLADYTALLFQVQGVSVTDFFAARSGVEVVLAGRAARVGAAAGPLRAALADERHTLDDPSAFARASLAFHERVAVATGSPTLVVAYQILESVLFRAAQLLSGDVDHDRVLAAHADHEALVLAIESSDVAAAREVWRQHSHPSDNTVIRKRSGNLLDLFGR